MPRNSIRGQVYGDMYSAARVPWGLDGRPDWSPGASRGPPRPRRGPLPGTRPLSAIGSRSMLFWALTGIIKLLNLLGKMHTNLDKSVKTVKTGLNMTVTLDSPCSVINDFYERLEPQWSRAVSDGRPRPGQEPWPAPGTARGALVAVPLL